MKRKLFIIFPLLLLETLSFSQQSDEMKFLLDSNFKVVKSNFHHQKAYSDTLWTEDFNGGLSACWSIVNNYSNNYEWDWDTIYRAGQYSTGIPKINSTTSGNGFMSLTMDFFNTPIPGSSIPMDTYFQSCAIPISPRASVELRFQEFNRFCCSNRARVVVQISTNNFQTFDEYNLRNEHVNYPSLNVEYRSLNVSRTLANADTAYLRFYMEGMSHYFWMIDDLALVEGNGQEVYALSYELQNANSSPFLTMFPQNYSAPMQFKAGVNSTTADTITSTSLATTVTHEEFLNGTNGLGVVLQQNKLVNTTGVLLPFDSSIVSTTVPWFTPTQSGTHSVLFESASLEYPQFARDSLQFIVSDTVFARDYGVANTTAALTSFSGTPPNSIGERRGILYTIDSSIARIQFSSISIYLLNVYDSEIRPVIWEYDTVRYSTTLGIGPEIASSLSTTMVDTSFADSWLTLMLDTGSAMQNVPNAGQFIVGWEERNSTSFTSHNYLPIGVDLDAVKFSKSNVSFGGSGQNTPWQILNDVPMIRLNIKPIPVGLNDAPLVNSSPLKIYPNPSSGIFQLDFKGRAEALRVFDVSGRLLMEDKTVQQKQIDLSGYPQGVYFLEVQMKNGAKVSNKLIRD